MFNRQDDDEYELNQEVLELDDDIFALRKDAIEPEDKNCLDISDNKLINSKNVVSQDPKNKEYTAFFNTLKYFDFGFSNFKARNIKENQYFPAMKDSSDDSNNSKSPQENIINIRKATKLLSSLTENSTASSKLNKKLCTIKNKTVMKYYLKNKMKSYFNFIENKNLTLKKESRKVKMTFKSDISLVTQISPTKVILGHMDGKISIVNIETMELEREYSDQQSKIVSILYMPELYSFVAASNDGIIKVYNENLVLSLKIFEYLGINCTICSCLANDERCILIGSQNGYIEQYACNGWRLLKEKKFMSYYITTMKVVDKYNWLIVGNYNGDIFLIQLNSLDIIATYNKIHFGFISYLEIYNENYFFSISREDNIIILWNICDKDALKVFDISSKCKNNAVNNWADAYFFTSTDFKYKRYSDKVIGINNDYNLVKYHIMSYYLLENNYLFIIDETLQVFCIELKTLDLMEDLNKLELERTSLNKNKKKEENLNTLNQSSIYLNNSSKMLEISFGSNDKLSPNDSGINFSFNKNNKSGFNYQDLDLNESDINSEISVREKQKKEQHNKYEILKNKNITNFKDIVSNKRVLFKSKSKVLKHLKVSNCLELTENLRTYYLDFIKAEMFGGNNAMKNECLVKQVLEFSNINKDFTNKKIYKFNLLYDFNYDILGKAKVNIKYINNVFLNQKLFNIFSSVVIFSNEKSNLYICKN